MTLRTRWWTEAIVAVTISLFAITAIRAVGMRGRDRAFAVTFSTVGVAYLLLANTPMFPHLQQW